MTRRSATGTYTGDDIAVTFSGRFVRELDAVEDIEIEAVTILGKDVPYHTLPDMVQELISALSSEVDWVAAE